MTYTAPQNVTSPRDTISNVEVLFDGGEESVSIARITWNDRVAIGMRWNISFREWDDEAKISEQNICLGMPVSRGYPTWFILPDELFEGDLDGSNLLRRFQQ